MNLTVACVCVFGTRDPKRRHYGLQYVERLKSMVARHLPIPHRFVCLTNEPDRLPGIATIEVSYLGTALRGWWSKLHLFNPLLPLTGRVLYFDLDVLVVDDLTPIATFPAEFALIPDMAPAFRAPHGLKLVHGYNSSVMVFDAGCRPQIWRNWDDDDAQRLWGDQDWIKEQCPDEATFPREWFRRLTAEPPPWTPAPKVVLCIKIKNHKAEQGWPWFANLWR